MQGTIIATQQDKVPTMIKDLVLFCGEKSDFVDQKLVSP